MHVLYCMVGRRDISTAVLLLLILLVRVFLIASDVPHTETE